MMEEYILVTTTIQKKEDAERIAGAIVEKRLAGCVQIVGPIASTYWWKEKIITEEEGLCLIKSSKNLYKELEKAIREIHPYEIPESIAVTIIAGSENYMKWLSNEFKN